MIQIYVLFHTHFGAVNFERKHGKDLSDFSLRPTPRKMSSSCGVCAIFKSETAEHLEDLVDDHVAAIYKELAPNTFEMLWSC